MTTLPSLTQRLLQTLPLTPSASRLILLPTSLLLGNGSSKAGADNTPTNSERAAALLEDYSHGVPAPINGHAVEGGRADATVNTNVKKPYEDGENEMSTEGWGMQNNTPHPRWGGGQSLSFECLD